jgi:hypothetical protein
VNGAGDPAAPRRVLITNYSLAGRSGTVSYASDLALELARQGDEPVVFTPHAGEPAEELAARGIEVVSDLERLRRPPDVIHGHHAHPTVVALLHLEGVPALFVVHDARAWHDDPPVHPRIRRYAAVDFLCRARLTERLGLPDERVAVLLNFVDLARFGPGPERPRKPRRALVFSNLAGPGTWSDVVVAACRARGLVVDVIGSGSGRPEARPEDLLAGYDVVFAKAKAALEAMAMGAATVLCDVEGLGPLVTAAGFDGLRPWNFGRQVLTEPHATAAVHARLDAYDPAEAAAVSALVRARCGLPDAVREVRALHADVLAEDRRLGRTDPAEERVALARWVAAFGGGNPLVAAAAHAEEAAHLRADVARLEAKVKELQERYVDAHWSARLRRSLRRMRRKVGL